MIAVSGEILEIGSDKIQSFETFRYKNQLYQKENAYNEFIQSISCRDAALMFAKFYEACGSGSYYVRQNYAEMAYNYFMGLN